jgi:erythronate-4-phosphate dehydrogenase
MHIIANDPPLQECGHAFPSWCTVNDVEACIRRADVLSVHVPLTTVGPHATRHLLSADLLAALPEHALLINAARGEVIATEVLHHEITNRRRQCVLDVWEHEPHIDAELALHATIATPHIAGHSAHAWQRGAHMAAEAWLRWKGLTEADISDAIARHTIPIPSADVIRPVVDESVAFKEALLHAPSHEVFETMRRSYRRRPEFLSPH